MLIKEITKEYLEKLDDEKLFMSLTKDSLFKAVMKRNPDILESFLMDLMNLDIDDGDYLVFLDKELIKGNIREKGKVVDINVRFGHKYLINIEVNKKKYQSVKRRNDLYIEKIDTLRLELNDKYHRDFDTEYLYQLKDERTKFGLSKEMNFDVINNIISSDKVVKYSAYLEYYYDLYYNGNDRRSFSEVFMASLMCKSYTELYDILSGILSEEKLNKLMRCVIEMTNEELIYNIHEWEKDKMEKLVEEDTIFYAKKEGREAGIKEGREDGREEAKENLIKNMLRENTDYEYISKITGKTIDEIKQIQSTMKEE